MNRKQLRDYYKTFRGDMSADGRKHSNVRRQVFNSFGKGLMSYFNKKAFAA